MRREIATEKSQSSAALLQLLTVELDQHLVNRDWPQTRNTLLELEGSLEEFVDQYSASLLPDSEILARVDWLISMQSQLEDLAVSLDPRLIEHPSLAIRIFATEVDLIPSRLFPLASVSARRNGS